MPTLAFKFVLVRKLLPALLIVLSALVCVADTNAPDPSDTVPLAKIKGSALLNVCPDKFDTSKLAMVIVGDPVL